MTMGDELLRIWAATGKTVVFVTAQPTEAVYLADEVIVMSRAARPHRRPSAGRAAAPAHLRDAERRRLRQRCATASGGTSANRREAR